MGLVNAMLILRNPLLPELPPMQILALADTGSEFLCIPEKVRAKLQLEPLEMRTITLADGSRPSVPYVGPVEARFKNRRGFFGALVMGDQVLLGAVPMEDMDLVIVPLMRTIDVNPLHPDRACGTVTYYSATREQLSLSECLPADEPASSTVPHL
jgi:clan AA aspartic protease